MATEITVRPVPLWVRVTFSICGPALLLVTLLHLFGVFGPFSLFWNGVLFAANAALIQFRASYGQYWKNH